MAYYTMQMGDEEGGTPSDRIPTYFDLVMQDLRRVGPGGAVVKIKCLQLFIRQY